MPPLYTSKNRLSRSIPRYVLDSIQDRFWAKVDKSGGDAACWLWTGATVDGYGYLAVKAIGPAPFRAHRISWEMCNGPLPPGMNVCHDCPTGDNPRCVNPAHLFLGTLADNNADMREKGRAEAGRGDRHSSRTHPESIPRGEKHIYRLHPERHARGESIGNARLTPAKVAEIRRAYIAGEGSYRSLAARFDVGKSTVEAVIRGRTWDTSP